MIEKNIDSLAVNVFIICLILLVSSCTAKEVIETRTAYLEMKKIESELNDGAAQNY